MTKDGFKPEQETQVFRKFGYGIARLFAGYRLRDMINNSRAEETKFVKDNFFELRHEDDPNFVEVAFNGDCKRVHYVNIGKNYHVGIIHDKESNKVEIVPKTLYKKEANGAMKMIDMKKTGFWPFKKSALEYDCGNKEDKKEVLSNYKNLKILAYSDPNLSEGDVKNTTKSATAMVNGRPHGKTSLAKLPNSMLNLGLFYISPTLYFIFGPRKSPSVTERLREKLLVADAQDGQDNFQKLKILKENIANSEIRALSAEKEVKDARSELHKIKEKNTNEPNSSVTLSSQSAKDATPLQSEVLQKSL